MMQIVQNLRIGTKLAVTSLLTILLVGGMILSELSGNAAVRQRSEAAGAQQTIVRTAVEMKAAIRGMMIGVRDIRSAKTEAEMQAARDLLAARQKSALGYLNEAVKLVKSAESRERLLKIEGLVGRYVAASNDIAAVRNEIVVGEAKVGVEAFLERFKVFNEESRRLARDAAPLADEMEELANGLVQSAKQMVEEENAAMSREMSATERNSLAIGLAVALLLIGACLFSVTTIARPMAVLTRAMKELADGNFAVVLPGLGRKDEIGDIATAVEGFKVKAEQKAREEAEAKMRQDEIAAGQRKAEMHRLAESFEAAIGQIVDTVSSASTELEASATTLTSVAGHAQGLTTTVAAASEQASANVQSVASATEELPSSIGEIGRQVHESARIAGDAVGQARATTERVSQLSKAATRIGDVVELINTIAGQTNLLALNATIEAARAGEAGRGFAVVASEVKALAEQTAKATGEIGQQISGIQEATQESVGAIQDISNTIEKLSGISSTIAAAVEQQGAATKEISRSVQQAAQGTQQVSANIADVQRGAGETGSASSQVLSAAQSLSGDSNRLKLEVDKFLNTVRAA
jgi:methyl-accepting chemotaxis protein